MSIHPENSNASGMGFLAVYLILGAIGIYLSYLSGVLVERWFGSGTSLLYFMLAFILALVAAFPLAWILTAPRGSRA